MLRTPHPPRLDASALSDEELVTGIRQGSEAHFVALYRRHFQRIYNFTYRRIGNHPDTEDLVQETFAAVFDSLDAYRGRSSLLGWMYGVAKNTVNSHLRRSRRQRETFEAARPRLVRGVSAPWSGDPEEDLLLRRYQEAIRRRLHHATPSQAEMFVMRYVEDLPIAEIARRTSRSNDAVRSTLYRVKRVLIEAGQPDVEGAHP